MSFKNKIHLLINIMEFFNIFYNFQLIFPTPYNLNMNEINFFLKKYYLQKIKFNFIIKKILKNSIMKSI